jgi:3-hydroxyacyl-CoA dehydrogenase/3a,7a,12a-trihydroxy-5b-cholest-24-enoyl-CoA hydratase
MHRTHFGQYQASSAALHVHTIYKSVISRRRPLLECLSPAAVDLKNAPGAVYYGEPRGERAGCTLTLSDDHFMGLVSGELKAQQLFFQGKLKLSGNIMLSQKLQTLFEARSKL